ncbi:hypothetical protein MG293_008671 [Ovis ammon polii]|uniref:Perilipin-4 n=1 Tax=Ovis ammon polii TaxID=230172 RepID=A0AAD4UBE8_OVIAM|nr:hypothetical protein MG293_008671 [Ovis ammon polii]
MSSGLSSVGHVAQEGMYTGVGITPNLLPDSKAATSVGLASSRAPDEGEQTIPSPTQAQHSDHGPLSTEAMFSQEATLGKVDAAPGATAHGQEGVQGFGALRDELEELGEIFQPMSAEEQAQLAATQPRRREITADQGSYFVRLGDVAPGFRQRAFEHALSHLQHSEFQARDALAQLEDAFREIEEAQQAPVRDVSSQPEEAAAGEVPATGALSRACNLVQQLHVAYSRLASGLQGLPTELQWQLQQARHSICELYGMVSSATTVAELPVKRLAESRQGVGQAWQGLEQVLRSVQQGPPLGWLVGPFTLPADGQLL